MSRTIVTVRGAYLLVVLAAGIAVLGQSVSTLVASPPGLAWLPLLALTGVAAWFPVRMPGIPMSVSLAETFTLTAVLFFGISAGVVGVALDGAVISLRLTRENRSLMRLLFNATAPALTLWIAGRLFPITPVLGRTGGADVGSWAFVGTLAGFTAAYFLLNTTLVAGAVALGRATSWYRVWRQHFAPLWVSPFVGALGADLAAVIALHRDGAGPTILLILPLVIALMVAFSRVLARLQRRSATFAQLRTFAAALRSTEDAVVITDTRGQLTYLNPAAERLTGWTSAEALGRHLDDVRRLQPINAAGDLEHAGASEYCLVRRDGGLVDIEETHTDIRDEDGVLVGTITTFRDIGARRALERARAAAFAREQEAHRLADEASRTKDEFLSTLSHELRTPTTAIMGWAQLLKSGRLDSDRTRQAIAALERNARAQAVVLNDLVDVSRIVRGTMLLELQRTDIGVVLRDALETVQPAREAKGIALAVSLPDDLPVIDADPNRLRQVFWNVLSNAVKFTPAGGTITVSAAAQDAVLRVEVSDTGIGIDPQFLPFVFDRFRQGDQSSTRQFGGLGLGLAIVRYVVEAHGGTVEVASDGLDRGTRVIVTLPATVRRRGGD